MQTIAYLESNGPARTSSATREGSAPDQEFLTLSPPLLLRAADKYAHAVIHHGSSLKPYIQDYKIGPLPISSATTLSPLRDIFHVPEIPFNARGFSGQMGEFREFVREMMAPLEEACLDLFGAVSRGHLSAFSCL